ncbi:MAG: D-glycero-beta-D-manno-heptose 1-phosphate adenylyltransferase [bacterium]
MEESAFQLPPDAAEAIAEWRARGFKIVFTNGCFDILHPGHIDILKRARRLGDVLIVGLNSDASTKRLKGENRPFIRESLRKTVLEELRSVDLVIIFDEDTPIRLIEALRPDVLVKGGDYDRAGVVGGDFVESYGGEVVLLELVPGLSTTELARKLGL